MTDVDIVFLLIVFGIPTMFILLAILDYKRGV